MASFAVLLIACLSRDFNVWKKLVVGLDDGSFCCIDAPGLLDLNPAKRESCCPRADPGSEVGGVVLSRDGDDEAWECWEADRLLLTGATISSVVGADVSSSVC